MFIYSYILFYYFYIYRSTDFIVGAREHDVPEVGNTDVQCDMLVTYNSTFKDLR